MLLTRLLLCEHSGVFSTDSTMQMFQSVDNRRWFAASRTYKNSQEGKQRGWTWNTKLIFSAPQYASKDLKACRGRFVKSEQDLGDFVAIIQNRQQNKTENNRFGAGI